MNERCIKMIAVAALLLGAGGTASAGEYSRGGTFLPLGWDARGQGMGKAATLFVRDDCSIHWNPANLAFLASPGVTVGATRPVPGLPNDFSVLSVGTGLFEERTDAGSAYTLRRMGVGISVSHLGLELAEGTAWGESVLGLAAAFAPNHYNSLGFTCRVMKNWTDLEEADAWGIALDLGWTALLRDGWWLGVVGRNALGRVRYPDTKDPVDPSWNIATAFDGLFGRWLFAECDLVLSGADARKILAGGDLAIVEDILHARCGAEIMLGGGGRTIFHAGLSAGIRAINLSLSFTFDPEDAFGRQTRVSLHYAR